MTGYESTASGFGLLSVSMTAVRSCLSRSRPPVPIPDSPLEDGAVMPEDDDPWFDEDFDGDGPEPEPMWNR